MMSTQPAATCGAVEPRSAGPGSEGFSGALDIHHNQNSALNRKLLEFTTVSSEISMPFNSMSPNTPTT